MRLILCRRNPVEALGGSFALRDLLVGAAHQLQQRRLVFSGNRRRLHRQEGHAERRGEPDRMKKPSQDHSRS